MKKILIINANPKAQSLTKSLSQQYAQSTSDRHQVVSVHVRDLSFDTDLHQGYDDIQPLEPDLLELQTHIKWADHIVIFSPVWWGSMPAKFKGVIDRIFLPGFAFKYEKGKSTPLKMLNGKTAELYFTLDTPPFWYKLFQGNVIYKQFKSTIFGITGIKNTSTNYFGPVISAKDKDITHWHHKVSHLAAKV
ncbi:NAD(P)H-dependent oxidoreductase [Thaumasiovibrio sp. DFM-14]|uniref:NAD(P)H-dependent oxidoreductase n=1 Tax=Thaumasiovibrio sp. DFM-14 TaxID=3384792 RepID=UPI0039A146B2